MALIPVFGTLGAAVATVISFVVVWGMRLYKSYSYISWKLQLKKDIVGYCVLGFQVICGLQESHCYVIQIMLFVILVLLNWSSLKGVLELIYRKVRG